MCCSCIWQMHHNDYPHQMWLNMVDERYTNCKRCFYDDYHCHSSGSLYLHDMHNFDYCNRPFDYNWSSGSTVNFRNSMHRASDAENIYNNLQFDWQPHFHYNRCSRKSNYWYLVLYWLEFLRFDLNRWHFYPFDTVSTEVNHFHSVPWAPFLDTLVYPAIPMPKHKWFPLLRTTYNLEWCMLHHKLNRKTKKKRSPI